MNQQQDNQQDLQAELEAARAEIANLEQRNADRSAAHAWTVAQLGAAKAELANLKQAHQCQLWDLRAAQDIDQQEFEKERVELQRQLKAQDAAGEQYHLRVQAEREEYQDKVAEIEAAAGELKGLLDANA